MSLSPEPGGTEAVERPRETTSEPVPSARGEGRTAVRNAIKLALSLTATWTVALVIKLQLPRHLGPVRFGEFNFSESFAAAFLCLVGLGVDTYVQKEISLRPQRASEFFGGVVVLRLLLSIPLFVVMAVTLHATGRPDELQLLVATFGASQLLMSLNATLAAMLQASTRVNALATVNVASKLTWGLGVMLGVIFDAPILLLAAPSVASELLRTAVLYPAARREIGLSFRVDVAATRQVVVASLPFFVNSISIVLMNRIDVNLLEFMVPGPEVGWYGAANNLAGLAMLLSPVFSWVLLPLFARAKERSEEDFFSILRRALEGLMLASIPVTLLIALGADLWIRVAFASEFAPAAVSLRWLAPVFVGTYLAMLLSTALIIVDQAWRLTTISVVGVLLQPVLMLISVPLLRVVGPGWAGAGAAFGVSGVELVISLLLLLTIGKRALDRRSVLAIGKSIGAAGVVIGAHWLMRPLGHWRLIPDMLLYVALVVATRAVRISDVRAALGMVLSSRRKKNVA